MRVSTLFVLAIFKLTHVFFGSGALKAQIMDGAVCRFEDPTSDKVLLTVGVDRSAEENIFSYKMYMKMHLVKTVVDNKSDFSARFVLRCSAEEWPLEKIAFLMIDEQKFPLELTQINPRNSVSISGSASMDGDVSISTDERQIFRLETDVDASVLEAMKPQSSIVMIFHSGIYPLTFKLSRSDLNAFRKLRDYSL